MIALTNASNAIVGIVQLAVLLFLLFIVYRWGNPAGLMCGGAAALICGCYMADMVNGGTTSNLTLTYSLVCFIIWLVYWGYAFMAMFTRIKADG